MRTKRLVGGANTLVSVVLAVVLTALVCYISTRRFARVDMTGKRFYTLQSRTRQMLRGLDKPLRVTIVYHEDPTQHGQLMRWVREEALEMLNEFKAINSKITVEEIQWDTEEGRPRLEELARRLDEDIIERCIIFESGDVHFATPLQDIIEPPTYPDQPFRFVGESVFATSLAKIISKEQQTVYFLTGHGERPLEGRSAAPGEGQELSVRETERGSLSRLVRMLRADNFESKTLSLTTEGKVPDDCAVLIVAGPRSALQEAELEAIRRYLDERDGNVIVLLDPQADTNFNDLLSAYGLKVDLDALALWVQKGTYQLTAEGLKPVSVADAAVPVLPDGYAQHAVTRDVRSYQLQFAYCAPVEVLNPRPAPGMSAMALLTCAKGTWGERTKQADMTRSQYDEATDVAGPVVIGAVVEPAGTQGYPPVGESAAQPGAKLVVFGNSYSFINQESDPKRAALLLNAVNWMAGRQQMLGIPPKEITDDRVTLAAGQARAARWLFILVAPGCIIALGAVVWWVRRR